MLAQGQAGPSRLALDATHVYWGNSLGGAIWRVVKDGTSAPEPVSAASSPAGIAVIGSTVYWINQGDNTLREAPVAGGSSTVVWTVVPSTVDLIAHGTVLCDAKPPDFSGNGAECFDTVPGQGTGLNLTSAFAPIALDDQYFYAFGFVPGVQSVNWYGLVPDATSGSFVTSSIGGGSPNLPTPTAMVAGGGCGLFWGDTEAIRLFLPGRSVYPQTIFLSPDPVRRMAYDDGYIYWSAGTSIGRLRAP